MHAKGKGKLHRELATLTKPYKNDTAETAALKKKAAEQAAKAAELAAKVVQGVEEIDGVEEKDQEAKRVELVKLQAEAEGAAREAARLTQEASEVNVGTQEALVNLADSDDDDDLNEAESKRREDSRARAAEETRQRHERLARAKPWFGLVCPDDAEAKKNSKAIGTHAKFAGKEGEDVDAFLRSFTAWVSANRWCESVACAFFAAHLEGSASRWHQTSLFSPDVPLTHRMKAMRKHFGEPATLRVARWESAARDRRQGAKEGVSAFAVSLEQLCEQSGIGEAEMARLFVHGLIPSLKQQLLLKGSKVTNFAGAVAYAKKFEAARLVAEGTSRRAPVQAVQPRALLPQQWAPQQGGRGRGGVPAGYQGGTGQRQPPSQGPTCFYCRQPGHMRRDCPKRREAMVRAAAAAQRQQAPAAGQVNRPVVSVPLLSLLSLLPLLSLSQMLLRSRKWGTGCADPRRPTL